MHIVVHLFARTQHSLKGGSQLAMLLGFGRFDRDGDGALAGPEVGGTKEMMQPCPLCPACHLFGRAGADQKLAGPEVGAEWLPACS